MLDPTTLTHLETTGASLLAWLVPMTLWAAALFAAAWIASRLLARRVAARWRVLLFAAVLARLALPADWGSPVGILAADAPAPPAASTSATIVTRAAAAGAAPSVATDIAPVSVATLAGTGLALAWLLGSLVVLGVGVAGRLRLARMLRRARPAALPLGVEPPATPVLAHPSLGPAVVGVLRPRIVLPERLLAQLDSASLARVLRHEQAHVERRDPWLTLALHAIVAAAWPVLPAWLAARSIRALCEEASDERALRAADASERRAYGHTLLDVARRAAPRPRLALGMLPFGSALTSRVRALRFERRWPGLAQGALALIVAALLIAVAGVRESDATPPPEAASLVESADSPVAATTRIEHVVATLQRLVPDGVRIEEARARRAGTVVVRAHADAKGPLFVFLRALGDTPGAVPGEIALAEGPAGGTDVLLTFHGDVVGIVRVEGNERLSDAAVLARVDVRPGEAFGAERVGDAVRPLRDSGLFDDVRVEASDSGPAGRTVTLHVTESSDVSDPRVLEVEGDDVRVRFAGEEDWTELDDGAVLWPGDVLRIPEGTSLPVDVENVTMRIGAGSMLTVRSGLLRVVPTSTRASDVPPQWRPLSSHARTLAHAALDDAKRVVEDMLSERGRVVVDERTNTIIYKDEAEGLAEIAAALDALDVPTPQFLIEHRLFEADASALDDFGFQATDASRAGQGVVVRRPARRIDTFELDRRASALEEVGALATLSRPMVMVELQGGEVEIESGALSGDWPWLRIVERPLETDDGVVVSGSIDLGNGTKGSFDLPADGSTQAVLLGPAPTPGRWALLFVTVRAQHP